MSSRSLAPTAGRRSLAHNVVRIDGFDCPLVELAGRMSQALDGAERALERGEKAGLFPRQPCAMRIAWQHAARRHADPVLKNLVLRNCFLWKTFFGFVRLLF